MTKVVEILRVRETTIFVVVIFFLGTRICIGSSGSGSSSSLGGVLTVFLVHMSFDRIQQRSVMTRQGSRIVGSGMNVVLRLHEVCSLVARVGSSVTWRIWVRGAQEQCLETTQNLLGSNATLDVLIEVNAKLLSDLFFVLFIFDDVFCIDDPNIILNGGLREFDLECDIFFLGYPLCLSTSEHLLGKSVKARIILESDTAVTVVITTTLQLTAKPIPRGIETCSAEKCVENHFASMKEEGVDQVRIIA